MRILIVKLGAFGDMIHALPALDDLLARPSAEVHWLIDQQYGFLEPLLKEQGAVVHQVALRGGSRRFTVFLEAVKRMRALKFDAVLDLQGLLKSGLLARAISSSCFGFDAKLSPEYGNQWLIRPVTFHAEERHVVQQYRRIAQAPFIKENSREPAEPIPYTAPTLRVQNFTTELCEHLQLMPKSYVLLHVGGGWQTKMLPDRTWCKAVEEIRALGLAPIFLWGSREEQQHAQHLASLSAAEAMLHRLKIKELCSLLSHAHAIIAADTGVLHLAAAADCQTISFWGPSASWRSAPLGEKHHHIESNPECGPCFKRRCDHFVCMDNIDIGELLHPLKLKGTF